MGPNYTDYYGTLNSLLRIPKIKYKKKNICCSFLRDAINGSKILKLKTVENIDDSDISNKALFTDTFNIVFSNKNLFTFLSCYLCYSEPPALTNNQLEPIRYSNHDRHYMFMNKRNALT